MHPVPTNADVLAILDRIMRRVARRLADEANGLLRRVFAEDVLHCPCGGRRSVIAVVVDPAVARALLAVLALPSESVTFAPAHAPPQTELAWDDAS